MKVFKGTLREIQQNLGGNFQAVVSISGGSPPNPGQYLQAHRERDLHAVVATSLFPGGISIDPQEELFTTAPSIPQHWQPGDRLLLRGPLGKGFDMPNQTSRLVLAALGKECAHLLPLAGAVLERGGEVALFTDHKPAHLPTQLEISPLSNLEEALGWADFLAVSGSPEAIAKLSVGLKRGKTVSCPAQALILMPMPCGSLGCCGVCAFTDKQGQILLVCEDGPVFNWDRLPSQI